MANPDPSRSGLWPLLKSLFGFARPHWIGGLVLLAGLIIESAFDAGFKFSFKLLIDDAIAPGKWRLLILMLLILAAGALISAAMSFGCDYLWARIGAQVMNVIRLKIFDHLQQLHMGFHSRAQVGDIMARFSTDLGSVESGLVIALPAGIIACGGIAFSMALLFRLEWRLALITVIGLPLCTIGPKLLGARAVDADYTLKQQEAQLASLVQENLSAQPLVKAFSLQGRAVADFGGRLQGLFDAGVRSAFLCYIIQRMPNVAILLVHLLVIGIGAVLAFKKLLSVGDLVAFHVLFTGMSSSVTALTWVVPYLVAAAGSMQRIREVLDEVPAVADAPDAQPLPSFQQEIHLQAVGFSYAPGQSSLADVELRIPKGAKVAFVGASGSGKSTLLALLMRLHDPQEGQLRFDGVDFRAATQDSLRRQMAVVFQDSFLFNISVRENIRLGRADATDAEVEAAAVQAEIHDFILSLPEGYSTPAGERGSRFSGGQRQRIALARALVRNPAILLLDEATSALDPATEAAVNQTLKRIAGDRTVVMVTHRLQTSVESNPIVVMEGGRIAESGSHDELLARDGRYAELWRKQTGFSLNDSGLEATITLDRLRSIPLFAQLDEARLASLHRELETEFCPEEQVVFRQGDYSDKFFVVVRGRVAVSQLGASGQAQRIAVLQVGDCFGEMGLINDAPRTATLQALTPCVFLTLSRSRFNRLLEASPELRQAITDLALAREGSQREALQEPPG